LRDVVLPFDPRETSNMRFIATITTAVCLQFAGVGSAWAQGDAQSTFEPPASPGAGQKLLEEFTGDWSVTKTFYLRNGETIRESGRCRQTMIHEGRFLQSEFVFERGGKKTTGLGITGFEPETGRFTSFWTDSRQTRMSVRRSRDRFDGKQIVLYSRSLDTAENEARRSRTVSHLEDGGRKLVHRQYTLGPGGEERLMMELLMIKEGSVNSSQR
jgi:hypothetical protein